MMEQSVLPFKLSVTEDVLTAHGGLALFGEFCVAIRLGEDIDRHLPAPGSGRGFAPSAYVQPLVLMLHGGGRSLEDLRMLAGDSGLQSLLGMEVPSADAFGNWLRRMGAGSGLRGLGDVHRRLLKWALKREDRKAYTLDIDATEIVAEKREAHPTYKGNRGYMPMVGHLAENGLVVHEAFRKGNEAPASRNMEFIEACVANMPKGKRIARLRADAAVKAAIAAIPEDRWLPWRDGEIASTVHCMNDTEAFTLLVVRKGRQLELDGTGSGWVYHAVATNHPDDAATVMDWYCKRGEYSENRIKELKLGFGMERMPCGQFAANAVFFRIGMLAYNLFVMFRTHALPEAWGRHQVRTIRWRLYQIAGRITRHARSLWIKVSGAHIALFRDIRRRCSQLACA